MATELIYSVRPRVVLKYLGQLCVAFAAMAAVLPIVSLVLDHGRAALLFGVMTLLLAAVGFVLARLNAPADVQANEALVVVAVMFLLAPVAVAYPLTVGPLDLGDALFEAISGITTTGLTTVATLGGSPRVFLFARAWLQWCGGLGFVVLSVLVVVRPGTVAKQLGAATNQTEDLVGGTKARATQMLRIYGILTVVGVVALTATGAGLFDAVVHALAGVSTGGFSSHDRSLAAFVGWPSQLALVLIFVAGAVPFTAYARARRQGWRELTGDPQIRTLLLLGLTVALAMLATDLVRGGGTTPRAAADAVVMAFSAQTTAGFALPDPRTLHDGAKLILIGAMLIGGGAGSTAGGFKLVRLLVLLVVLRAAIVRTALPVHAVYEPRVGGHRVTQGQVEEAVALLTVFLATVLLSWLAFLAYDYPPLDSLFEVVSATGTVGLSTGITRPELEPLLKGVLGADMLLGRLEMLALLVLFAPRTWFGHRKEAQ